MTIRRRVPLLKLRHEYTPSIDLADVAVGDTFLHSDGSRLRRYMLIDRDPWKATIIRYTFVDRFITRLGDWVRDCITKR